MSLQQFNTENFNKTILEDKKDALVEFSAPWCVYCRRIEPAVKALAETYSDLIIAQINIDDEAELAEKYNIELVPTLIYFKNGEAMGNIVAPDSKAKIEEFIKEHM